MVNGSRQGFKTPTPVVQKRIDNVVGAIGDIFATPPITMTEGGRVELSNAVPRRLSNMARNNTDFLSSGGPIMQKLAMAPVRSRIVQATRGFRKK